MFWLPSLSLSSDMNLVIVVTIIILLVITLLAITRAHQYRGTTPGPQDRAPVWGIHADDGMFWRAADPLPVNPLPLPDDSRIGEIHMQDFTVTQLTNETPPVPEDQPVLSPSGLPTITMRVNLEKIEGAGEDAEPLLLIGQSGSAWVGVFDGVGGAGKKRYPVKETEWTGARIASFTARWAVETWIKRQAQFFTPDQMDRVLDGLSSQVRQSLCMMDSRYPASGPVITGTAIRAFPTTVAIGLMEASGGDRARIRTFWAGDSRVYLLSPHQGLCPLTTDHVLDSNPDSNRTSDSPMTNLASASSPFYLEERVYDGGLPAIMFAATDGCFEYFESPILFEKALLSTMADASSADQWGRMMTDLFSTVSSDDATMSLTAVGWPTFDALKTSFVRRCAYVEALGAELNRFNGDIRALETQIEDLKLQRSRRAEAQWQDYRRDYVIAAEGRRSH